MRFLYVLFLILAFFFFAASSAQACTTADCSDGLFCNGLETCDSLSGDCVAASSSTLDTLCESSSQLSTCKIGYCNSAQQTCAAYADHTIGNPCGLSNIGRCSIGRLQCDARTGHVVCVGRIDPRPEPSTPNNLDDDCDGLIDEATRVPCAETTDCQASTSCSESRCVSGFCVYTTKNVGELCESTASACLGPFYCNDHGQCMARSDVACATSAYTTDPTVRSDCIVTKCINDQCVNVKWEGPCDDGNPCTVNDACAASGTCVGTPVACDDKNPCTMDSCNITGGCIHELMPSCATGASVTTTPSDPSSQEEPVGEKSSTDTESVNDSDDPAFWILILSLTFVVPAILLIVALTIYFVWKSVNKSKKKKQRNK